MSKRYRYPDNSHYLLEDTKTGKLLGPGEVAELVNGQCEQIGVLEAMRVAATALVNNSRDGDAWTALISAVEVLNPKTIDQLQAERNAAADHLYKTLDEAMTYSTHDVGVAVKKYDIAKLAHEQAVKQGDGVGS